MRKFFAGNRSVFFGVMRKLKRPVPKLIAAVVLLLAVALAAGIVCRPQIESALNRNVDIVPVETGDFAFRNENRDFGAAFVERKRPKAPFASYHWKDGQISMGLLDETGSPAAFKGVVSGPSGIVMGDVLPKTDLTYRIQDKGLKEEIVLKEPAAINQATEDINYVFAISLDGAEPVARKDGTLTPYFVGKDGKTYAFEFAKPMMYDDTGDESMSIPFYIRRTKPTDPWYRKDAATSTGQFILVLKPSKSWLTDPARKFPIKIDPTIVHDDATDFNAGTYQDTQYGVVSTASSSSGGIDGYTKLLLHGNGENNSTAIVDSSLVEHVLTPYGNAKISTTPSKFGGASMSFPGGTNNYVTSPDSSDWHFLSEQYTIDAWVYTTADGINQIIVGQGGGYGGYNQGAGGQEWAFGRTVSNYLFFQWSTGGTGLSTIYSSTNSPKTRGITWLRYGTVRTSSSMLTA